MSFRAKLIGLCLFLSALSVTIGAMSYLGLKNTESALTNLTDKAMPKLALVNDMFLSYRRIRITLRTIGLPGISKKDEEQAVTEAASFIESYEKSEKAYADLGFTDGQKELYEDFSGLWKDFRAVCERVLALQKSGKPEDREAIVKIFFTDDIRVAKTYTVAINKLLEYHKKSAEAGVAAAKETGKRANATIILVALLGVSIGIAIGIAFANSIAKTILKIAGVLSSNSDQVATASNQIAASSQELSQAATQQAASLQETSAAVEQLSSMVTKNAENAKNTASSSAQSQEKAGEGKEAVNRMMQSMDEINQSNDSIMDQINASNQQMAGIANVIKEIGNKTKVINDIVFQTKLLSFNASVEAARAGEHGKGFAVVAEEVGNLAQMSGNAAKEISDMLEDSIRKVEEDRQPNENKGREGWFPRERERSKSESTWRAAAETS